MVSLRNKYTYLAVSVVLAIWLAFSQIIANQYLLLACLLTFLAFVSISALNGMAMPVLLFFLPWATLLKTAPGTISFYTIAILAIILVSFIRNFRELDPVHILLTTFLVLITLIPKVGNGYPIDNRYILFFICLFFIHLIGKYKSCDFYILTVFFALGIVLAALSARQLVGFSTISRYIDVKTYDDLTRLSGYYGDPNFYAAHITAALSGLMIISIYEKGVSKKLFLFVTALLLVYCGLLSASKSFIIIFVCLFLFWMLEILLMRGKLSFKIVLIFSVFILMAFVVSSTVFVDLIDMVIGRFRHDTNISSFSTGRTDIWLRYFTAMKEDVKLLLFGQGFSSVILGDKISHNTLIQLLYQFGLVGTPFIIMWIWRLIKINIGNIRLDYGTFQNGLILLIGVFGPWIAIDLLFFDEFFLMLFYACACVVYINEKRTSE